MGNNWGELKSNQYIQKYTNYPTQLLEFSHDKEKIHPTQKPILLFEYLIKTYTYEGDVVLDNCIGSGTTAIACINTNRSYIGFELEKDIMIWQINVLKID
ncbi:site-specific DNA-methyltransferase [Metaclostridioides mangenotii]|uniref:site-specific DNA-methyltransferase n=1 Tax=Metaclostridioides mangenotii TaxID=1540 RepID=UPI0004BBF134|nr:site-specific DNA-methyltransferase [Clostridioides mangenotii]